MLRKKSNSGKVGKLRLAPTFLPMKDSRKLQEKLNNLLKGRNDLKVFCQWPWNDLEFKEVATVVKTFVERNGEVVNDDPLTEWLEEYQFFLSGSGGT